MDIIRGSTSLLEKGRNRGGGLTGSHSRWTRAKEIQREYEKDQREQHGEPPKGGDIVGKPRFTAAKTEEAKAKVRRTGTSISLSKIGTKINSQSRLALSGSADALLIMLKLLALNVLLHDHPQHPRRVPHHCLIITKDHFHLSGKQSIKCPMTLLADG